MKASKKWRLYLLGATSILNHGEDFSLPKSSQLTNIDFKTPIEEQAWNMVGNHLNQAISYYSHEK